MRNKIEGCVLAYHRQLIADPHHRYRSWGHCYRYFRGVRLGRLTLDYDLAALQLGFYLASWGMYRGGSFLLWKDYKLHSYAVRDLFREEYRSLWDLDCVTMRDRRATAWILLDLAEKLRATYRINVKTVNGTRRKINLTDTLITKILLGTMACTPAYDEYVCDGFYAERIKYSYLNERHILALWDFCSDHDQQFRQVRRRITENGLRYPPMKLVDMYFWIRGRRAAARWESA